MRALTYFVLMIFVALYYICILECNGHTHIKEEKRIPNVLHQYAFRRMSRRDIVKAIANSLVRSPVRRGHQHMTDAGYGSRINAASKMASALIAQHDIYGAYGPGKRKRTSAETSLELSNRLMDTSTNMKSV